MPKLGCVPAGELVSSKSDLGYEQVHGSINRVLYLKPYQYPDFGSMGSNQNWLDMILRGYDQEYDVMNHCQG